MYGSRVEMVSRREEVRPAVSRTCLIGVGPSTSRHLAAPSPRGLPTCRNERFDVRPMVPRRRTRSFGPFNLRNDLRLNYRFDVLPKVPAAECRQRRLLQKTAPGGRKV